MAAKTRWELRKRVWFWVTIALVVVLHMPIVLLVHWSDNRYPGVALLPAVLADYGVVYGCIKLVEMAMKARKEEWLSRYRGCREYRVSRSVHLSTLRILPVEYDPVSITL